MSTPDLTQAKEIINHQGMPAQLAEVHVEHPTHRPECLRDNECGCDGEYLEDFTIRGYHAPCVLQDHAGCEVFLTTDTAYHFHRTSFVDKKTGKYSQDLPNHYLRATSPEQSLSQYKEEAKPFTYPWLTTAAVLKQAERPVPWLWEPYLAPGALTVLYADSDAGKSTLICNFLAQMFGGESEFLGRPIFPAFVLYLSEDPPIALKWRTMSAPFAPLRESDHIRWLRQGTVVPSTDKEGNVIPARVTEWDSETGPSYKTMIHEALRQHKESVLADLPVLIIIDTITTFLSFGEDGNSSPEVAKMMREFALLAEITGAAVLALHHARRPRGKQYRVEYLGSGQFRAQCEVFLSLQRQAFGRGSRQRSLELEKTRLSEHKEPIAIRLNDDKVYEIDTDPPKKTQGEGESKMEERYREIWKANIAFPGQSNRALAKMLQLSDDKIVKRALDYGEEHGWDEEESPDAA